jgi:hypothetical protein
LGAGPVCDQPGHAEDWGMFFYVAPITVEQFRECRNCGNFKQWIKKPVECKYNFPIVGGKCNKWTRAIYFNNKEQKECQ